MLQCCLALAGASSLLGGCATSEKSVYERHLHTTVMAQPDVSATATFIGASQIMTHDALASVDTGAP